MESYRYIRKLYFLFVLFLYIYICGLRDAGILNDLGRSNYKDSKAHLSEDNLVRFLALANGLASRRKLESWVYLRFCMERGCVHLRR